MSTMRIFGDYLLLGEIAAGGMGVVYRAKQISLNRTVALKTLRAGSLARAIDIQRFRTEAEAAAGLDHPNIVSIYETGEHEGLHYISMKFVDGISLAQEIQGKPLPIRRAVELITTVASAVHHAHQRGVLHRDLKPGNILLDENGQPYVTDFGIAKILHHDAGLTASQAIVGTPSYMAPEQAAGQAKSVTVAADIYGLGAVLFEMLTGRPPFRSDNPAEILRQVIDAEPPRPSDLNPDVDIDLQTICLKCLEKDPPRRYASCELLADDLHRWLEGKTITARAPTTRERAVKWVRRHPLVSVSVTAVFVILALTLIAVQQWRHREDADVRTRLRAAEEQFAGGETPLALAVLARLVRDHPDNWIATERLANALRQRVFMLPVNDDTGEGRVTETGDSTTTTSANLPEVERLSPDGSKKLIRTNAVNIQVWEVRSGALSRTISNAHERVIRDWRWSRDGTRIVTAAADDKAKIWDALNEGPPRISVEHSDAVHSAELSSDGTRLVTASRDGTARLWNATNGAPIGELMHHRVPLNAARFSPDGWLVVTATENGSVRIWSGATGLPLSDPVQLGQEVIDIRFNAEGLRVTAMLESGSKFSFRLTSGLKLKQAVGEDGATAPPASPGLAQASLLRSLERDPSLGIIGRIKSHDASPDTWFLATASEDNRVRVWDARTSRLIPITTLDQRASFNSVRFSPDGRRLATSTENQQVRLWDARSGHPLSDWIDVPDPFMSVRFSTNGRSLFAVPRWSWELHVADGPAPSWLPELAEFVSEVLLNSRRAQESVPAGSQIQPHATDILPVWAKELITDDPVLGEK